MGSHVSAQDRSEFELQREINVVVVADDPPQFGASEIVCGEQVHAICVPYFLFRPRAFRARQATAESRAAGR